MEHTTTSGFDFLAIYVGPTLVLTLARGPFAKMVRAAKQQNSVYVADFVTNRYGKSQTVVGYRYGLRLRRHSSLACVALQLKAANRSFLPPQQRRADRLIPRFDTLAPWDGVVFHCGLSLGIKNPRRDILAGRGRSNSVKVARKCRRTNCKTNGPRLHLGPRVVRTGERISSACRAVSSSHGTATRRS
jgi:hypothetical protein